MWCFHAWWALDSDADPIVLEAGGDDDSLGPSLSASARTSTTNAKLAHMPQNRLPLPPDWRSVLRFQASLFHWLADETARCKVQAATSPVPEVDDAARAELIQQVRQVAAQDLEVAMRHALVEAAEREQLRAQLLKAKGEVEHAAWQQ